MPLIEATDADFLPLLARHERVLVKYYADWCGHCRLLAPSFARLAGEEQATGLVFLKVNSEFNPQARQLGQVNDLPFFAAFRHGQLVSFGAARHEAEVREMVENLVMQS